MTEKAAIKATYSDYRRVKGRKVLQLIFEVPLEQAPEVHDVFGEPSPDGSTWVAIARLQSQPAAQQAEKPTWSEKPRSQQAAIKCENVDFRAFLRSHGFAVDSPQAATVAIKQWCLIQSRTELDTDPMKAKTWDKLYSDYQLWSRGAKAA